MVQVMKSKCSVPCFNIFGFLSCKHIKKGYYNDFLFRKFYQEILLIRDPAVYIISFDLASVAR